MKICSKCKEEKPLTREYFHKDKNQKDGFVGMCKVCKKKYYEENKEYITRMTRKYREENKEHYQENRKKYREENKERIAKKTKIYYEENKEELLEYRNKYYESNKEYILEQTKLYREGNKEHLKKRGKEYYQKNKERVAERSKQYHEDNREYILSKNREYYQDNKEQILEWNRQYNKENPHIARQGGQRRKARVEKLPYTLTVEEWDNLKLYFDNSCAYCGMAEEKHLKKFNEILHQEHFIALSNGGEYTHNNIIPSCKSCNSSKGNKDFFEWYPTYEFYNKDREKFILEYLSCKDNIHQLSIL